MITVTVPTYMSKLPWWKRLWFVFVPPVLVFHIKCDVSELNIDSMWTTVSAYEKESLIGDLIEW